MPFYARLGFVEVPAAERRPEVEAVFRAEAARGFDSAAAPGDAARARRARAGCARPRHADLDFVLALERTPENASFVGQWSREEHAAAFARARSRALDHRAPRGRRRAGFLIAYDLVASGFGAYVKRVVVDEKSRGLGREALAQFLEHARSELAAPYVWLTVYRDNARAQRVYRALGFRTLTPAERAELAGADEIGDRPAHVDVMRVEL